METTRQFLRLTPLALGVSVVAGVLYMGLGSFSLEGVGLGLVVALVATAGALVAILVAAGVLRLLRVSNAWAVLGSAVALVAVVCGVCYASIAASMPPGDEGWNLLFVMVAAAAPVPAWLGYAVGLLVRGRRDRSARSQAVSPTT